MYFLLTENRTVEERAEIDELLRAEPERRRGRAALLGGLGGDVVRKS
jgi:hypothetical protein